MLHEKRRNGSLSFFQPSFPTLRPSFPGDELTSNRWVPSLSGHNSTRRIFQIFPDSSSSSLQSSLCRASRTNSSRGARWRRTWWSIVKTCDIVGQQFGIVYPLSRDHIIDFVNESIFFRTFLKVNTLKIEKIREIK